MSSPRKEELKDLNVFILKQNNRFKANTFELIFTSHYGMIVRVKPETDIAEMFKGFTKMGDIAEIKLSKNLAEDDNFINQLKAGLEVISNSGEISN